MTARRAKTAEDPFTAIDLIAFFGLAFAISWGLAAAVALSPALSLGQANPVFILAVWSPAIAALVLVARRAGARGVARFLSRLGLWRMGAGWWAVLILAVPAAFYLGAWIKPEPVDFTPVEPLSAIPAALGLALIVGPVEEIGWRGFALPLIQRRVSPLVAALGLGLAWGVWHLPVFLLPGTAHAEWSFPVFVVSVMAVSVITTALFNAARGGLLAPVLMHFQSNNPLFPDAQPYDAIGFIVLAGVVVYARRTTMFAPGAGARRVLS